MVLNSLENISVLSYWALIIITILLMIIMEDIIVIMMMIGKCSVTNGELELIDMKYDYS